MADPRGPFVITRRRFIQGTAATLVLAGCGESGDGNGGTGAEAGAGAAPQETFTEPTKRLSGELKILMWSHFVPRHDKWFDRFAKDWGRRVGVNVTVDHIEVTTIPARLESEISARSGHDVAQFIGPLPQLEPSVIDLADVTKEAERRFGKQIDLCRRSSLNPTTNKYYAYSPGWVPDPGNFRKSMWADVGLPDGPSTWEELREGGAEIQAKRRVPVGIGMSQEIDSNMAGRALLWSFGGAIQDEQERVVLNSPETVEAVTYMKGLFEDAMTNEVFAWNPASNNQALVAGKLSYILNSISAYRTMQQVNPSVAEDVFFVPALKGPQAALAAQHVMYNWLVPEFAKNPDAAQEFLLHYTANFARATWESELYDFPAFAKLSPQLDEWLDDDPFGSKPSDKLSVLKNALDWSSNVGREGSANTAIGEVFGTFIIPNMYARAARGRATPQEAVARAERQIEPIFAKWRKRGLLGGA
ncbi:MAG TPA: extracellular solute-binding protein [Solirubrobacteraceae bacterium]|nr:extracellular solute-binding protein [Solirubrobacteraceae bacterium]